MMRLEISAGRVNDFFFAPKNELEEIIQNIRTILTTRKGSVPLDREFGIDVGIIDQPVTRARAVLTANIINAVERYEPRVSVTEVTFSGDGMEGEIYPVIKVAIK